jgi:O-antigen/teichoic acid export membrane protein
MGLTRRSTFTGALWNVAAAVFPLVSTLLLSVAIGRRLGSTALGQQSVIAYMGSLVGGLVVIAASNCTTQVLAAAFGAGDPGRFATLTRLSARVHLVGGLLAAVVLGGIGTAHDLVWAWVLIGLVTFLDALGWSHGSRLVALQGWGAVSPLRLVSQLGGTLLGVGAVFLGLGLPGVFGAQVLTSAWLTACLRRRDRRLRPDLRSAPAPVQLRPLVRLWSLYIAGMALTQVVNKRIELVFLDASASSHAVAVYAVAFTVVSAAVTVPTALAQAAMPAITAAGAADGEEALRADLRRGIRLAVLGGLLIVAALATIGPPLVLTLWGPSLTDASAILPWLALAALGAPLVSLLDVYWAANNRLAALLVVGAVSAGIDLGLAGALVPPLGVTGAIVANVAGQVSGVLGLLFLTQRLAPGVLPGPRFVVRSAVLALVIGGAGWAAGVVLSGVGPVVALLGAALAFLVALGLLGRVVGLLDGPDVHWLAGLLPGAIRPLLPFLGGIRYRGAPVPEPAIP